MPSIPRIADKAGVLGTVTAAMGCGGCFPALASLGAAVGLGFLQQFEGLFVTTLLPLFAALALLANAVGWLRHRQWHRSMLGVIGPALVLAGRFLWIVPVLYLGMALMVAIAVWDLFSPARRRCAPEGCALPAQHG